MAARFFRAAMQYRNNKNREDSDAYMDYGKYGDNHHQRGFNYYGGGRHCQYGTR